MKREQNNKNPEGLKEPAPKGPSDTNLHSVETSIKNFTNVKEKERIFRKTICVPKSLLTTNKTNYTVTNYLPINNTKLTNSNNKQPTNDSTNHSLILDSLSHFVGGVIFG